ncbi:unnamed protein product [Closterium sp. NIES-53]
MDVWGPARDLLVLRLHSDRGGEFSSDLLRKFCRGEGILYSFTFPAFPQQNGVAERRIGLVMEVARISMVHAAAPHFLWPFAVQYATHQLNLWPRVSLLKTSPTLRWTGKVGDASVFRVWGSCAFGRDTSADKLSPYAIPCVFLGFPPDAHGWQFYHPTSRRVLPTQDFTFEVAPLGVSQVDPLPLAEPVKVAVDLGAARGASSGVGEPGSAEPRDAEPEGAEPGSAEYEGAESGVAKPESAKPGGIEPEGADLGGVESKGALSGGAEPRGTASAIGAAGASPRVSHQREPLSPQQLREWFAKRTRVGSGASGAGGSADGGIGAGGARATIRGGARTGGTGAVGPGGTGGGGPGGAGAAGPGGARTGGIGAAGAGGVVGPGVGDPGAGGTRARDPGAGGTGAGGARAGGTGAGGAGDSNSGGASTGGAGAGGTSAGGAGAGGTGARGARAGGAGAGGG